MMNDVFLIGAGMTPVGKHADRSLGKIGAAAVYGALQQAEIDRAEIGALYVGNMLSALLCQQQLAAVVVANEIGLQGAEAFTAEGACGSGAAAFRLGYMAIASRTQPIVIVCGLEKMAHCSREQSTTALATAPHRESEGSKGLSFLDINARLMSNYMTRHDVCHSRFAGFSINAHKNAYTNPNAMLKRRIDEQDYLNSKEICKPLKLLDVPPICDGAAAVVLGDRSMARKSRRAGIPVSRVIASAAASDELALSARKGCSLLAAKRSCDEAYRLAGVAPKIISLFEPHDAYTVLTAMSLESAGFAPHGEGAYYAEPEYIGLQGELPICTFGGLKARGHPVGATGIYQIAECHDQLAGLAGKNQVKDAEIAMAQNFGGAASVAFTHILAAY